MNENFWYPREPMVYLADTLAMDPITECAYNRFIEYYYLTGKPLPDVPAELMSIGKVKECDWMRVRGTILTKGFYIDSGAWHHKRIDETLKDMQDKRFRNRHRTEAGRKALAEARAASVTDSVTDTVTTPVNGSITDVQVQLQRQVQLERQSQPHPQSEKGVGTAASPRSTKCDAEWLDELSKNPAYTHISLSIELGKCVAWCNERRRTATRRTFINWLNRIDRPLTPYPKEGQSPVIQAKTLTFP